MVPYGYRNGAAGLMTALQKFRGDDVLQRIVIYLNGIVVPGGNFEGHLELLDRTLTHLEAAGFTVYLNK